MCEYKVKFENVYIKIYNLIWFVILKQFFCYVGIQNKRIFSGLSQLNNFIFLLRACVYLLKAKNPKMINLFEFLKRFINVFKKITLYIYSLLNLSNYYLKI